MQGITEIEMTLCFLLCPFTQCYVCASFKGAHQKHHKNQHEYTILICSQVIFRQKQSETGSFPEDCNSGRISFLNATLRKIELHLEYVESYREYFLLSEIHMLF